MQNLKIVFLEIRSFFYDYVYRVDLGILNCERILFNCFQNNVNKNEFNRKEVRVIKI